VRTLVLGGSLSWACHRGDRPCHKVPGPCAAGTRRGDMSPELIRLHGDRETGDTGAGEGAGTRPGCSAAPSPATWGKAMGRLGGQGRGGTLFISSTRCTEHRAGSRGLNRGHTARRTPSGDTEELDDGLTVRSGRSARTMWPPVRLPATIVRQGKVAGRMTARMGSPTGAAGRPRWTRGAARDTRAGRVGH